MNRGLLLRIAWRRRFSDFLFLALLPFCLGLAGADAWGQVAFVKTIGTASTSSSGTATTINVPAAGVAAGNRVIVSLAMDPAGGSVSCSDSAGHVYEVDANIANGSGTSGVRIIVLSAHMTTPLIGGSTINCTHPSIAPRAVSANEFAGIAANSPRDQISAATGSGSAVTSGFTAITTQSQEMLFGAIGVEGKSSESFTAGSGYAVIGRAGTNQGNPASNITVNPEFRTVNATGSYAATGTLGTATRWAAAIVTYRAASTETVASKLAITSVNGGNSPTAGIGFSVAVQSQDAVGNPANVTAATTVNLTLSQGTGTLGGTLTGTIAAGSNGVTISNITYTKAETGVVLTASGMSGDALAAGDSEAFTVNPGAASNLAFTIHPGNANAGAVIPGPPTATVQDSFGNIVTASSATVTIGIAANPGGGILGGTTTKNAVAGVVSFADLTIYQAENGYALGASSSGLIGATSNSFNVLQAAAEITFVKTIGTVTSKTTAGSTSIAIPSVGVSAGHSVILAVAIDPAAGAVSCNDSRGNSYVIDRDTVNGAGTAGVRIVTLSAHNVSALTSGDNITCMHPAVAARALSANEFAGLAASATRDQTAGAGGSGVSPSSGFTEPTDHASELLFGIIGVEGPSNDKFTPGTAYTSVGRAGTNGGNAATNITVNPEYRIANATGSFAATGTLSTGRQWAATLVTYRAAAPAATPSKLAIVSVNNGDNPTAGAGFPVMVQSQDASGNPANVKAATTISLTLKAGTGNLGGTLTGTIDAGANQATVSGVTYTQAESGVVLTATRTSGDALTAGDSDGFEVHPGAAAALAFTIQPQSADAGSMIPGPPTVAVHDAFGNTVVSSNASISVGIGSNPGGGNLGGSTAQHALGGIASFSDLTINQPGEGYTVTASSAGLVGATSSAFNITSASGNTSTVSGSVTRASDEAAIGGALIEALQSNVVQRSAVSAANGAFAISGLSPGVYDFRASAGGFTSQTENGVSVVAGSSTAVNFSLNQAPAGAGIVYIYDRLSRLRAVVDPTSDTAIYNYDAVGNLLSISRQSSQSVSIVEFTPASGPIGSIVTIFGTGFNATPSQNTVTFNGVAASVALSTATQIVTSVPSGASTGMIAVSTPGGSASSNEVFTVESGTTGPIISGFSPTIGPAGTPVTITGANFDTTPSKNTVRFNPTQASVTGASSTSINTSVPVAARSGKVFVTTPAGTDVSSEDFFIPPSGLAVNDVEWTGRLTVGGPGVVVPVNTAGKVALALFDGVVGQKISIKVSDSTFPDTGAFTTSASLKVIKPDGFQMAQLNWHSANGAINTSGTTSSNFLDAQTLPLTGTYTLILDPTGSNTGQATVTLYDIPSEFQGTIAPGGAAVAVATTVPGQNASLTFSATQNQVVSIRVSNSTYPNAGSFTTSATLRLIRPDGTVLRSMSWHSANGAINTGGTTSANFIDAVTLPLEGTYTIQADPNWSYTGEATIELYDIPPENQGTITPGGAPVTVATPVPGQNARLTFSGAQNQVVSIRVSNSTYPNAGSFTTSATLRLIRPDGTVLRSMTWHSSNGAINTGGTTSTNFTDALTLPLEGTYTIQADPNWSYTGQATIELYDVPPENQGTITPGGEPVTVATPVPGQNASLTFSAAANQRVSVVVNNSTYQNAGSFTTSATLRLIKPDGAIQASMSWHASSAFLDTQPLATGGTYTLKVDPNWTYTGQATLTLHDVQDATGTLVINGASVPVNITTPGQNGIFTFTGASNQQVTVRITGNTISSVNVRLNRPDGTQLTATTSSSSSFNLATQTLPQDGTYTIVVNPPGANLGSMNVSVTSP